MKAHYRLKLKINMVQIIAQHWSDFWDIKAITYVKCDDKNHFLEITSWGRKARPIVKGLLRKMRLKWRGGWWLWIVRFKAVFLVQDPYGQTATSSLRYWHGLRTLAEDNKFNLVLKAGVTFVLFVILSIASSKIWVEFFFICTNLLHCTCTSVWATVLNGFHTVFFAHRKAFLCLS